MVTGVAIETTVEQQKHGRLIPVHLTFWKQITLTSLAHLKTSQLGYLLVPVLLKVAFFGHRTNDLPASADDRTARAELGFLQSENELGVSQPV